MSDQIQRYNDGAYYAYEGIVYIGTFPEEWATNHWPDTGPHECGNCFHWGSVRNVFIGYCTNCADHVYNGCRGRGFIDVATESENIYLSVFNTYLKDINVDNINIENANTPDEVVYNDAYHANVFYDFITNFEEPLDENKETEFDYADDALDMTAINMCHFEDGYNDW
jgi:hypothetical protein